MSKHIFICAIVGVVGMAVGCGDSTSPPTQTGSLSLSAGYSTSPPSAYQKVGVVAAVDSIKISRARFSLRDITFKGQEDSLNYITSPFILEVNLSGALQNVAVVNVAFRTYRRVEFDVHRVEPADLTGLPDGERARFADFLAGDRYSIIINGTVYPNGGGPQSFVFRSRINARQRIDLVPELVVSETSPIANVTILLSSANWFRNAGGVLVDPSELQNESLISENLKNSIRVFKDNNRDGSKDN